MIEAHYNPALVALSILVATWTAHSAFEVAPRIRQNAGMTNFWVWLVIAAFCLGGGIWSMHFIAMMAYIVPMPVTYDIPITALSLVLPVAMAGVGFYLIHRTERCPSWLVPAVGVLFGIAISSMHYIGMAAMRMPAVIDYDLRFVGLSVVIAIAAAIPALKLSIQYQSFWTVVTGSAIMGVAISGMHYTAMYATSMVPNGMRMDDDVPTVDNVQLALWVFIVAAAILTAGIWIANYDRHRC